MPNRLTKIYTRTGDAGETQLGETRLSKAHARVAAAGDIDELNAHLGLLAVEVADDDINACLLHIQHDLFNLGGELHAPQAIAITPDNVTYLETQLDAWNADLPPLQEFVLPGGNRAGAIAHVARTVCRRAERSLARLHETTPLSNPEMLRYLNRLSDLLFVISRVLVRRDGKEETLWQR